MKKILIDLIKKDYNILLALVSFDIPEPSPYRENGKLYGTAAIDKLHGKSGYAIFFNLENNGYGTEYFNFNEAELKELINLAKSEQFQSLINFI